MSSTQDLSSIYQDTKTTFTGEGSLSIMYDLGIVDFIGVDPVKDAYIGNFYTILGSCGLSIDQDFGIIEYAGNDELQLYDLTNTLQIAFDVRIFNEKIGLIKDTTNQTIIDTSYNSNGIFPSQQLVITSEDFLKELSKQNIISLGKLVSIYRDFLRNTNFYFYYPLDFPSIFDASGTYDISGGEFTETTLIEILTQQSSDSQGNNNYKLNGNIILNDINNLLRNINVSDPFSNRTNLTMADGFLAGDLILIEKGLTFNLDVTCIDDNNVETILLRKNVQVPVLLRLDNLS